MTAKLITSAYIDSTPSSGLNGVREEVTITPRYLNFELASDDLRQPVEDGEWWEPWGEDPTNIKNRLWGIHAARDLPVLLRPSALVELQSAFSEYRAEIDAANERAAALEAARRATDEDAEMWFARGDECARDVWARLNQTELGEVVAAEALGTEVLRVTPDDVLNATLVFKNGHKEDVSDYSWGPSMRVPAQLSSFVTLGVSDVMYEQFTAAIRTQHEGGIFSPNRPMRAAQPLTSPDFDTQTSGYCFELFFPRSACSLARSRMSSIATFENVMAAASTIGLADGYVRLDPTPHRYLFHVMATTSTDPYGKTPVEWIAWYMRNRGDGETWRMMLGMKYNPYPRIVVGLEMSEWTTRRNLYNTLNTMQAINYTYVAERQKALEQLDSLVVATDIFSETVRFPLGVEYVALQRGAWPAHMTRLRISLSFREQQKQAQQDRPSKDLNIHMMEDATASGQSALQYYNTIREMKTALSALNEVYDRASFEETFGARWTLGYREYIGQYDDDDDDEDDEGDDEDGEGGWEGGSAFVRPPPATRSNPPPAKPKGKGKGKGNAPTRKSARSSTAPPAKRTRDELSSTDGADVTMREIIV